MLGFRGHFLTKSRRYSVTFAATPRPPECSYRRGAQLTRHPRPRRPTNPIVVINDWEVTGIGHRNYGERELAEGIANRQLAHKRLRGAISTSGPTVEENNTA